jgi:hypothetical protein
VRGNARRRIRARSRKRGFPLREEIGRLATMSDLADHRGEKQCEKKWRGRSDAERKRKKKIDSRVK